LSYDLSSGDRSATVLRTHLAVGGIPILVFSQAYAFDNTYTTAPPKQTYQEALHCRLMKQFEKEGLNRDLEKVLGIVKKPQQEECEPIPRLLEMNRPVKD
jgi:hypothetical protein